METHLSGDLQRALDRIPERQRAALLLAEVHDLTGLELAAALGVSHVAARALLTRARESLRQALAVERAADADAEAEADAASSRRATNRIRDPMSLRRGRAAAARRLVRSARPRPVPRRRTPRRPPRPDRGGLARRPPRSCPDCRAPTRTMPPSAWSCGRSAERTPAPAARPVGSDGGRDRAGSPMFRDGRAAVAAAASAPRSLCPPQRGTRRGRRRRDADLLPAVRRRRRDAVRHPQRGATASPSCRCNLMPLHEKQVR